MGRGRDLPAPSPAVSRGPPPPRCPRPARSPPRSRPAKRLRKPHPACRELGAALGRLPLGGGGRKACRGCSPPPRPRGPVSAWLVGGGAEGRASPCARDVPPGSRSRRGQRRNERALEDGVPLALAGCLLSTTMSCLGGLPGPTWPAESLRRAEWGAACCGTVVCRHRPPPGSGLLRPGRPASTT